MSGKPQYDDDAVLEAAIAVFWRHGYATASINDLTEATGLSRSSLYLRFRDKDGLFHHALEAYTERLLRRMGSVTGDSARDRLEKLLRSFVPRTSATKRPAGCLLSRSCSELVDLPAAERPIARAGVARQWEIFANLLRDGVRSGELAGDADVEGLAWYYLGILQATVNLPQAGATVDTLDRMIDVAMSVWPARRRVRPRHPRHNPA